ncbi:MAG: hypothetical protein JWM28_1501 [Chitinophagaceae bacterium]|nr:hypothetical protein [Chitinophagaceae bacterium]
MQKINLLLLFILAAVSSFSQQNAYSDSIRSYISKYIQTHDVIHGDDAKYFRFFPADEAYRVKAKFKKTENGRWFQMETSGPIKQTFRVYGIAEFSIHDTVATLNIYQSQDLMQNTEYSQYLFVPFTDLTTGIESYHTGKYIDLTIQDIKNGQLTIDFNKAYNPSCAYVSGKYNCPVPPRENNLPVAIRAGEMIFGKKE